MFAPGDEVECVWMGAPEYEAASPIKVGDRCTILATLPCGGVLVVEAAAPPGFNGWNEACFRKVQKRKDTRNLTEWLSQPSGYDEEQQNPAPKAPAKKRELAS